MILKFTQVILLSATMPQEVLEVTTRFMRDPVRILVKKEELTLEGIRQMWNLDMLRDLYESLRVGSQSISAMFAHPSDFSAFPAGSP